MAMQLQLKMEKQWHQSNKGFSYIESIIVLLIVTVILLIVPKFHFNVESISEEEINDELISFLNYYQTMAYETEHVIVVSFPLRSDTIYVHSKGLNLKASYTIKGGSIYEGNSINNTEIIFKKNGVAKGGTIIYQIGGTKYKIIVQLYRGRMRIEKI